MLISRAPTFGFLFWGGVRFFRALRAYIKAFKDLGCAAGFQVERLLFHGRPGCKSTQLCNPSFTILGMHQIKAVTYRPFR